MVEVVANGRQEVLSLRIDPEVVNSDDTEMLQILSLLPLMMLSTVPGNGVRRDGQTHRWMKIRPVLTRTASCRAPYDSSSKWKKLI